MTTVFAAGHRFPLAVTLVAFVVFIPFIFLRYEFHDSWAWLYYMNGSRLFAGIPCFELGGYGHATGKPLMNFIYCGMTAFGAVIDRVWIPKLVALLLLFACGGLLLSVFRRAGVSTLIASLVLFSILLLPGMIFIVVYMTTNPLAYAALASILAGFIWLRYLRHPRHGLVTRLVLSVCVFVLLLVAMFTYPVVAPLFFVPLLIEILFSKQEDGIYQFIYPVLAAGTFALASVVYVIGHKTLLYEYHYFILSEKHVLSMLTDSRNITLAFGIGEIAQKLEFLGKSLLPGLLKLWFISENAASSPVAVAVLGGLVVVAVGLFVWRTANVWRSLALFFTVASFFGTFLVSPNIGNGLYLTERVKVFMQVPLVLLLWWLVHELAVSAGKLRVRALAGLIALAIFSGTAISWLVIMRARVIPNYMELVHYEHRLKEAVRQDVREIYIIKADDGHLRATLGSRGIEELGRITSFYFPQHLVIAVLQEIERKAVRRAIISVEAGEGDAIKPAPGRMIIDMRKFP